MSELISISPGNVKMGGIPSISLPPVVTCGAKVPCRDHCYALRMQQRLPKLKEAWERNLRIYQAAPQVYRRQVEDYLTRHKPEKFRWHVGGDIPEPRYLDVMAQVARKFPRTLFLCFTKRYSWFLHHITVKNLTIMFSMWPGLPYPGLPLPRAWVNMPGVELPDEYFKCKGGCSSCGACWELVRLGKDVVFDLH